MPCITQSQSEAWDIIRGGRNGGGRRAAAKAVAKPGAISGGQSGVHALFRAALALLVSVSITCSLTLGLSVPLSQVELSAQIVVTAEGSWLGNMAQAVDPLAEDGSYIPPARVT
jgi:hypothetical protein